MKHKFKLLSIKLAVILLLAFGLFGYNAHHAEKADGPILSTDPVEYGSTPLIDPNANPQVQSAVEALETGKYPERLSVLMYSDQPFDLEKYRQCPEDYLNIVEPGRAFQPAQPGPGVPRLAPNGRPFYQIMQGEYVQLSVKGLPFIPVTFTSTDLGIFENQLTTITVETDENGIARAKMYGTSGTINDVNILAASPVASGQVKFIVKVTKANQPERRANV